MILIDTDHTTHLKYAESERGARLIARLEVAQESEVVSVAIVSVEERMRGWLASIAKEKISIRQIAPYRELSQLFEFLGITQLGHWARFRPMRFRPVL